MPKAKRDDFPKRVIERLRMRVAHRCSNPNCRVPTVGPGEDTDAVANIGKAAHIAAAAPGGPRYLEAMTPAERSSINNAIWLCSNCAVDIDVNPDAYRIPLLHEWKRLAEQSADVEKGKRLPHPDDARNQLVAALSGMPVPFAAAAIPNVHGATEQVLEALDPRFRVVTSYRNKVTTYEFHARENVDFQFRFPAYMGVAWQTAMQDLFDHGRDAKLPAAGIQVKGLPALEKMFSGMEQDSAYLCVESDKKAAIQKLRLIDPDTQLVEQFDDLVGQVSFGRKTATFEGSACGGMLEMSASVAWVSAENRTAIHLASNFDQWDKRDVRFLPHFDKLLRLFESLAAGWEADMELEIDGLSVLRAKGTISAESEAIQSRNTILRFTACMRTVARHLDKEIRFSTDATISRADFVRAMEVADIIEGRRVYGRSELRSNTTCTIVAQDRASNIRHLIDNGNPTTFIILADDEGQLSAFGQSIQMPKLEILLNGVFPKVHHADPSAIKDGDAVKVEFEPVDGFTFALRYLKPGEDGLQLPCLGDLDQLSAG